jgi:hypothetical protein
MRDIAVGADAFHPTSHCQTIPMIAGDQMKMSSRQFMRSPLRHSDWPDAAFRSLVNFP